ncbi:PfkB family carbohydrate kinase [Streptomyces sp. Je 1-79]|uniref:carbohydrate kinase family protein n=1 Tax=Streptomyces sp. Je 1-79 TaxID=2943847 RepID=UPI0021A8D31F|nr:PfkB family carbohydrate kinase [Streptomyces sp. Je 1-79]MCT4355098.1 PfkB family carbohydrate kinase [Streptomyces sp. Je 1-79]
MSGLLVVGDVVTDIVARHRTPLAPATDTAAEIRRLPGGAGANAACWAARSGCRPVALLGRVGTDEAGWHDLALRRAGVRPMLIPDGQAGTATVIALVDASAERTFLTDSGAALRISPADWADTLLDGMARLHLSGYLFFAESSRAAALRALRGAREAGVPVSVDPASAGFLKQLGADRFLAAARGAEALFPNADEAMLLTGCAEPAEAAAALSRAFPLVAVTLGAGGALVAEAGAVTGRVAAPEVRPVDSTGAGDAFTGAFLAARLAGADPLEAAAAGCRAGAEAVTVVGGRPRASP